MSTHQAILKAIAAFEREHDHAGAVVFLQIKHHSAAAKSDTADSGFSLPLVEAVAYLQGPEATGKHIEAVTAHITENGQLQAIVPVYPPEEDDGHAGGCCGGCGG
ncbi:MAG: hypothetical protein KBC57_03570 [Neisseriaceae bacterium]|nr:hypothetical protein [Neisseriaceae bacterium]MBP6861416.1 hypothetical protein [Neisseriaceae bacterium]